MVKLIYRKSKPEFNSIENVFDAILPYLSVDKIELPYLSKGVLLRKKNIDFIKSIPAKLFHITGNDHYLILGIKKKKSILTIHDIEVLKRTSGFKKFLLKRYWFDLPIRHATVVTTISEFSKKELMDLRAYKTPIKVIYNPLTLAITYSPNTLNIDCPNILLIGTKENKNLKRLIRAIEHIKCHLTIIGKLNNTQTQLLKSKNIVYANKTNLTNEEMITEYMNSDILSFVSTYEGFGLPIIEAQACGRPVITSNISSMPEIAGKGAILVNPFDEKEIKKGIEELISNTELRNNIIKEGLENIKRFEPKKIANEYQNLYYSILDES